MPVKISVRRLLALYQYRPGPFPIETIRGGAILLVVLFHVIGASPESGLGISADSPLRALNDSLNLVHMPLFAMLAGLVMEMQPPSLADLPGFLSKKVRRLVVPGLLAIAIFALLVDVMGLRAFGVAPIWHHVFFPFAHFWFLQAVLVVFVVAGIARSVTRHAPAILLLLSTVLPLAGYTPDTSFMSLPNAIWLLTFFCLGQIVWQYRDVVLQKRARLATLSLMIVAAIAAFRVWQFVETGNANLTTGAPLNLAFSAAICVLSLTMPTEIDWLARLGPPSFVIYLYHPLATSGMRRALQWMGVEALVPHLVLGVAAGILLPMVLYILAAQTSLTRRVVLGLKS